MKNYACILALSFALLLLSLPRGSAAAGAAPAPPQGPGDARERILAVHREAFKKPRSEAAFRAYTETLPRDGEFFVVEGDIPMTEDELRTYVRSSSRAPRAVEFVAAKLERFASLFKEELIYNIKDGAPDFYKDPARRNLTYAVDRQSFPSTESYETTVRNVREAGTAWVDACPTCGVRFTHLPQHDASPSTATVNFVVRFHDLPGNLLAEAFFPHWEPARRFVNLDPNYFAPEVSTIAVGVLRHELGHTLGYRHEQLQEQKPGCFQPGETPEADDGPWRPLTPYDSASVMHYFCGKNEGGQMNPTLQLSPNDIEAHRRLYRLPPPADVAGFIATATATAAAPATGFSLPAAPNAAAPAAATAYLAAVRNPDDPAAVRAYAATLPRDGEFFVVEGDMLMTEDELTDYLPSKATAEGGTDTSAGLFLNYLNDEADFYADLASRRLTYAVERASFETAAQYDDAVRAMRRAAASWRAACRRCGVRFEHLGRFDAGGADGRVNFVVRRHDAGGAYAAAAFFPHDDSPRRVVRIDPSFFKLAPGAAADGVLRHALGHVLGYAHAGPGGLAGCVREGDHWRPLAPTRGESVMSYGCGGATPRPELSRADRASHRRLYDRRLASRTARART